MALIDLQSELRGAVPKLPFSFTKTLINRAYRVIRESGLWSFNLFESAWITPPIVNTGTVNVTQGLAAIQFDPVATAALNAAQLASPYSLITQRQFRIGVGGIYSIISYNQTSGAATLDRIFADPGGNSLAFTVLQVYYPAPYQDFLVWISVRNMQMFLDLGLDMTRAEVDARDPQRSWYQFPTEVVPYARDARAGSATPGFPLFELWGIPVTPFTYDCYGIRRGTDLVNPTDALPLPIGDDLVLAKAYSYAYEWAEANKDIAPRAVGPDFKFLIGKKEDEYKKLLTMYRRQDREYVDNWFTSRQIPWSSKAFGYFNTIAGTAGPYTQA